MVRNAPASYSSGRLAYPTAHRLSTLRALDAEVVRYRAWAVEAPKVKFPRCARKAKILARKAGLRKKGAAAMGKLTRKTFYARVPVAVKEFLRLRIQGDSGEAPSEDRIARMAVKVMESHAYDPVSAVSALSHDFFLECGSPTRVLGSGHYGIVFLEEDTGYVVKVMLDDDAAHEYALLRAFADAGLAPKPISLDGPRATATGNLYNIRMEAVDQTLNKLLRAEAPPSAHPVAAGGDALARNVGETVAAALSKMRESGLVHGDLHLENIGLKGDGLAPSVLLIDFSRGATTADRPAGKSSEAFCAGHALDVFNVIEELCVSFEMLKEELAEYRKNQERHLRSLARRGAGSMADEHRAHQIAATRAHLAATEGALERAEITHNTILGAVTQYACAAFDWTFEGCASVRNRRMRTEAGKRRRAAFSAYFKSDLYWGDWQYKA